MRGLFMLGLNDIGMVPHECFHDLDLRPEERDCRETTRTPRGKIFGGQIFPDREMDLSSADDEDDARRELREQLPNQAKAGINLIKLLGLTGGREMSDAVTAYIIGGMDEVVEYFFHGSEATKSIPRLTRMAAVCKFAEKMEQYCPQIDEDTEEMILKRIPSSRGEEYDDIRRLGVLLKGSAFGRKVDELRLRQGTKTY